MMHLQSAIAEHAVNLQRYLTALMVSGGAIATAPVTVLPSAAQCLSAGLTYTSLSFPSSTSPLQRMLSGTEDYERLAFSGE